MSVIRESKLIVFHYDDTTSEYEGKIRYHLHRDGVTVIDADGNRHEHRDVLRTDVVVTR